ncbi:MAG TPA: hypothetical protein VGN54_06005 [Mycobacteriales bacterium]|jgi:hypothetical protein|nr:hypothetical protein [Mycobacteriales bacterium]
MIPTLIAVFVLLAACWWLIGYLSRRRDAKIMIVTTRPAVELEQPYGGWDANPYDAGTGHDRSWSPVAGSCYPPGWPGRR